MRADADAGWRESMTLSLAIAILCSNRGRLHRETLWKGTESEEEILEAGSQGAEAP